MPLLRTSQLGFKFYDALHLAFAEAGGADIFLTTDDRLLRKAQQYRDLINGFFGLSYAMDGVIRNETLIETGVAAIFVNCFRSRAN
ncbi:hypothetical protein MICAI_2180007 [Microcystis sp. T1-4]|nr:hypothetical protein [Microcystis aeruginosa]CCI31850.1 hypothetical protein MICAI_2180007 [Microcystis sp. T1-4]